MILPGLFVDAADLFYLRAAAVEWLRDNPSSKNAPKVREALLNTQEEQDAGTT
jgi:hypothetical protein